jgi:hypothetical protein
MKLSRNDKCHCGSGEKYKNCCYENDVKKPITKNNNVNYNNIPKYRPCLKLGRGRYKKSSRYSMYKE